MAGDEWTQSGIWNISLREVFRSDIHSGAGWQEIVGQPFLPQMLEDEMDAITFDRHAFFCRCRFPSTASCSVEKFSVSETQLI